MVKDKSFEGKKVIVTYNSSTIDKIVYDTSTNILTVYFSKGNIYEYYDVPHETLVKINGADSSGKAFMTEIKQFTYKKINNNEDD